MIAAKRNKDIAKPKIPSIKTLLLPMRSLNLPQKGLKKIQANAEIEKIKPTWNSLNPNDLISWGTKINIVDCPAPMHANAADKTQIELGVFFLSVIC